MTRLRYLNDKDPWMLGEDIPDIDFFFSQIWLSGFVNEFKRPAGCAYKKILSVYRGYHLWFYYGEKDANEVGEHIVQKFLSQPSFAVEVNREIVHWADRLRRYCDTIYEADLDHYSNKKLWKIYERHDQVHTKYYQWGWIPVAADMFHANFTEKLKGYLRGIGVGEEKLNEYLVILTQPTKKSLIQIEREEFLKIAVAAKKSKGRIAPKILSALKRHYQKYFYVNHMWVGEPFAFEHYEKELRNMLAQRNNPAKLLASEQGAFKKNVTARQMLIRKLRVTGGWKTLFDAFGDFMITKIYRRFAQIYAVYKMEFVLKEIGRRLGLSLMQVRFMLPQEVRASLLSNKLDRKELMERKKFCVYYAERGKDVIFTGLKAEKLAKSAQKVEVGEVSELKGQTGCIGKAQGIVKVVIRPADMAKMQKGDILVSIATDPDIVPAMKKAAAIVTEQGGVTSHAAIVSRELNVPCLIGTKIATRVFKDGDVVEVDATAGLVRKLS